MLDWWEKNFATCELGEGAMRFCEVLKIQVLNHLFRGAIAAK
ncbi:MAG: hypothetical protein ACYTX0_63085 [Nostoc sp.]